ncbi:MAG: hypothetical protein JO356_19055 [Acidobacteria bacterium]|nr:hypothetical protein [Acidobacteriota bacterium]
MADDSGFLLSQMMEELSVEFQHINVKLLLHEPEPVDLEAIVPIFHSWIQDQVSEDLLLDVASYGHVKAGPGVVLIGHEADYSLDHTDDRLGLRYNRKAVLEGTNQERFERAMRQALLALERLEHEPALQGKLRFNGRDIEIFINDRLIAPNCSDSLNQLEQELRKLLAKLLAGQSYSFAYESDPRRLLGVRIQFGRDFTTVDLIKNIGPAPVEQVS